MRFRLEYPESKTLLRITILDAWDLPQLSADGSTDPYVEVSLRTKSRGVAKDKYTTSIKPSCTNPIFNEIAELPLQKEDVDTGELVIKVMDSDFLCQDEMIGNIRLHLSHLNLSKDSAEHTCLILHDTKEYLRHQQFSLSDASSLQLKMSEQASKIYEIQLLLKSSKDELEQVYGL